MTVRLATPEDEAALFTLLGALRAENNTFGFQVDDAMIAEHIHQGTRAQGGIHGVIDAPDQPGVLAGSIGIVWDKFWFSSEWGLAIIWLFVLPEYRKGHHYADDLLVWAKKIRADLEAAAGQKVRMANSVISETRIEAKSRFWRRHSSRQIGIIFEISFQTDLYIGAQKIFYSRHILIDSDII